MKEKTCELLCDILGFYSDEDSGVSLLGCLATSIFRDTEDGDSKVL
jgi:hypothetical protein